MRLSGLLWVSCRPRLLLQCSGVLSGVCGWRVELILVLLHGCSMRFSGILWAVDWLFGARFGSRGKWSSARSAFVEKCRQ